MSGNEVTKLVVSNHRLVARRSLTLGVNRTRLLMRVAPHVHLKPSGEQTASLRVAPTVQLSDCVKDDSPRNALLLASVHGASIANDSSQTTNAVTADGSSDGQSQITATPEKRIAPLYNKAGEAIVDSWRFKTT